MKTNKKIILGIAVGAAAGIGLGILFAPKKGREIRKSLVESGGDYLDKFSDDIKYSIEDKLDNFLNKSSDKAEERAKKQIEEVKKQIAEIKAN